MVRTYCTLGFVVSDSVEWFEPADFLIRGARDFRTAARLMSANGSKFELLPTVVKAKILSCASPMRFMRGWSASSSQWLECGDAREWGHRGRGVANLMLEVAVHMAPE